MPKAKFILSNEAQAKAEKRGVWGIEGLKPAWEFRAEKANSANEPKNLPDSKR